jgi:hypothetical protein
MGLMLVRRLQARAGLSFAITDTPISPRDRSTRA